MASKGCALICVIAQILALHCAAEALGNESVEAHQQHFYLLVQCAWCGISIDVQQVDEPPPVSISHGICASCYAWMSDESAPS